MEVILLERIDRLGQMGDVVSVKAGFARNYLFPQKKALRSNKDSKAYFESQRAELEAINAKRRGEAQGVSTKMDGIKLIIVRQAGEGGQLYGSVTARDVADALKAQGIQTEGLTVLLNAPVKTLGTFTTAVRLHAEVKVNVDFTVARSMEEAHMNLAKAAELLERAEDAEKLTAEAEAPAEAEAEGEAEAAEANA